MTILTMIIIIIAQTITRTMMLIIIKIMMILITMILKYLYNAYRHSIIIIYIKGKTDAVQTTDINEIDSSYLNLDMARNDNVFCLTHSTIKEKKTV